MDYGSAIWGTKKYQKCETIQNRAMRTFLGVTKATPVVGMYGELGWLPPSYRHQISCVKLWYRLCLLEKERVTRRVADWDYLCNSKRRNGWHHDIKDILTRCNLQNIYESRDVSNLSESRLIHLTKDVLMNDFVTEWKRSISDYSRLDIYCGIKSKYEMEIYISSCVGKFYRSTIAKLRLGVFPLKVETGRYRNIPHSQRVCSSCNKQAVDNTQHFLLVCEKHKQLWEKFFKTVSEKLNIQFVNMFCVDRLSILLSHSLVVNDTAKYAIEAYRNR